MTFTSPFRQFCLVASKHGRFFQYKFNFRLGAGCDRRFAHPAHIAILDRNGTAKSPMAQRFIISGTGPGAGRTTVGCALAFAFKARGMRVGIMKPAATGCVERDGVLAADDAASLLAGASSDLPLDLVSPYRYRSALAPWEAARADGTAPPDYAAIDRALRQIETRSDAVIVEDTHGLAAKLDAAHDFADLARAHGLELILVVGHRAGYTRDAIDALEFAGLHGIAVRGVILNALDREGSAAIVSDAEVLARATGARILGTVRFKEPLSLAIVQQLL
jgi:dethiobiotin synthetase